MSRFDWLNIKAENSGWGLLSIVGFTHDQGGPGTAKSQPGTAKSAQGYSLCKDIRSQNRNTWLCMSLCSSVQSKS